MNPEILIADLTAIAKAPGHLSRIAQAAVDEIVRMRETLTYIKVTAQDDELPHLAELCAKGLGENAL